MVPLAGRGAVGRKSSGLQGLGCRCAVRTALQRRRDRLHRTRIVPAGRKCRLRQGLQDRLAQRCRLLLVVRCLRHVAGHNALRGPIHPGVGIPTGGPTCVVRLHDGQRGIRAAPLGCVSRWRIDLGGRCAPTCLSAPLARGFGLTAARAFGVCCGLGFRFPTPPRGLDVGHARLAPGQLRGERIPPTAASGRLVGLLLLVGVRHPRRTVRPYPLHCLLPLAVTHRRVT